MDEPRIIKNTKPIKFGGQIGMVIDELDRGGISRISQKEGSEDRKARAKVQKYKNKGVWRDGLYFRSQLEMKRYCQLKMLFYSGEIAGFVLQPEFILQEGNDENRGITYKADFLILNKDGSYSVEDTKG